MLLYAVADVGRKIHLNVMNMPGEVLGSQGAPRDLGILSGFQ